MKCSGKLPRLFLALALSLSLAVPALADSNEIRSAGSGGTSTVTLSVAPSTFNVTVPTDLAISVAADGAVTCASTAKIVNNGKGPVQVKAVSVTGVNGWTAVDYQSSFAGEKVNAKKIGLKLNDTVLSGDVAGTFAVINGGSEQSFTYAANIPAQSEAVSTTVANITFTIGWYTAA